jgi:hypothetical protein
MLTKKQKTAIGASIIMVVIVVLIIVVIIMTRKKKTDTSSSKTVASINPSSSSADYVYSPQWEGEVAKCPDVSDSYILLLGKRRYLDQTGFKSLTTIKVVDSSFVSNIPNGSNFPLVKQIVPVAGSYDAAYEGHYVKSSTASEVYQLLSGYKFLIPDQNTLTDRTTIKVYGECVKFNFIPIGSQYA